MREERERKREGSKRKIRCKWNERERIFCSGKYHTLIMISMHANIVHVMPYIVVDIASEVGDAKGMCLI